MWLLVSDSPAPTFDLSVASGRKQSVITVLHGRHRPQDRPAIDALRLDQQLPLRPSFWSAVSQDEHELSSRDDSEEQWYRCIYRRAHDNDRPRDRERGRRRTENDELEQDGENDLKQFV